MKMSSTTRDILKNFCLINESIIIREGNSLNTTSTAGNVIAVANLEDHFPANAYIYNLSELLNVLGDVFSEPDIEFKDTHFEITDDSSQMTYYFADENLINISDRVPDESKLDRVLEFVLTADNLKDLLKASAVMGLPDFVLVNDEGDMVMQVTNSKNPSANTYGKILGPSELDSNYHLNFRAENIKFVKGDYKVIVFSKNNKFIAKFVHLNMDLSYWIALEPSSSVDE